MDKSIVDFDYFVGILVNYSVDFGSSRYYVVFF